MIIDAIIILGGTIISIFAGLFSLITLPIPADFTNSLIYFFGYFNYAGGIINIPALFGTMGFMAAFISGYYTVKLILLAYAHLPFIGKKAKLH
jgi:hypothetical protein